MRSLALCLLVGLLATSCNNVADRNASPTETPAATTTVADPPSTTDVDDLLRVTVSLGHCGISQIEFDGRYWEAVDNRFGSTNADDAPGAASFVGQGTVELVSPDELHYTDDSGLMLRYAPTEMIRTVCS
jgi:hypothetical protein